MAKSSKPAGHTSQKVDRIASNLLRNSRDPKVRSVAAAALSDARTTPKTHQPVAHTRNQVASMAGSLMNTGNKNERSVAAPVLADHKTKKR
jgi:hypothetical protein